MCEGRGVTRPHPTEIPYLLAFFPSLRAASDRTLSVYFPIRPQTYDGRFYDMELKRIVDRHWHKLSDDDREVVDRELPRIKAQLAAVRPVECPCMAAFADESKGVLRLIRLPEETEDRLEVDPPLLAPLELMLRKHPPSLIVIAHKEQAQTFASILDEVSPVSYKRLYLAGPDEAVAELEKLLPPSLKKIIAGRLSASLDRSVGELEVDLRKQLAAKRA